MNEVKVGKLPIIDSYTSNFISKLLQGGKIWRLFAQLFKNQSHCFVLEVSTVSRFQNRICSPSQGKGKNVYIAHEEMGTATVDSR